MEARQQCNRGHPLKGLLIEAGRARALMLSLCHCEGQSIHSCLFRDSQHSFPKALNTGDILSQESGGGGEKERKCCRAELQNCTIPVSELAYVVLLEGCGGWGETQFCFNFVLHKEPASSRLFRNIKTLTGLERSAQRRIHWRLCVLGLTHGNEGPC